MDSAARAETVVHAPVEEVWAVVGDPRTQPQWWPDVNGVRLNGEVVEGMEYVRSSPARLLERGESIWVVDRLERLKEVHYHCTISGMYAHFCLTPAQDSTFVELETGMLPPNLRWRIMKVMSGSYLRNWVRETLDALPGAVSSRRTADTAD